MPPSVDFLIEISYHHIEYKRQYGGDVMGFLRKFGDDKIKRMTTGQNAELFGRLKADVLAGEVFPAVRVNELHFYYKGGRLYKFANGRFVRDPRYSIYSRGAKIADPYERAKAENANKFTNPKGGAAERRLLDGLYRHTYGAGQGSDVVVLDIEVNLNGRDVQKCDLLLFNTITRELMFAEGKVFSDRRVKCAEGRTPEVIGQVKSYTSSVAAQRGTIVEQYCRYTDIVNRLFGTEFKPPLSIAEPVKLLVYQTDVNAVRTIDIIENNLGRGNVMWTAGEPSLREIWEALR